MENNKISKSMTYKGLPLVRKNNEIYYGHMYDDYVVYMKIIETKDVKTTVGNSETLKVATKVKVYKMSTDRKLSPAEAIAQTGERNGLYEALDLAAAWAGN
ncbi:MAG: hypothetical protein LBR54_04135 [Oscillospiraceae bacterium]|jgi:hypothetical protein|nr:hypothetical protein [Oscillospiraceae bacterium]